jgi:Cdc6-like AAA superfamily ATPase
MQLLSGLLVSALGVTLSMFINPNAFRNPLNRPQFRVSGQIRMFRKDSDFFNRKHEQTYLTNSFSSLEPTFFVLLGQSSTGKTALVRHVLSEVGSAKKQFDPLFLNLRGADISSRTLLYKYLLDCTLTAGPVWRMFGESLSRMLNVKLDVKQIGGIDANARDSNKSDIPSQFSDLIQLIPSSDRRGILVIDEADCLKDLASGDYKV